METSDTAGRRTIVVREPDAATKRAPQNNQLMSERGILSLKPDLRLEQRGQHGQDKPDEPDHRGNLADASLNKPELGFRHTQAPYPLQAVKKNPPARTGGRWAGESLSAHPQIFRGRFAPVLHLFVAHLGTLSQVAKAGSFHGRDVHKQAW